MNLYEKQESVGSLNPLFEQSLRLLDQRPQRIQTPITQVGSRTSTEERRPQNGADCSIQPHLKFGLSS